MTTPSARTDDAPEETLEQIIATYSTPEFTEALLNHFQRAKRQALAGVHNLELARTIECSLNHPDPVS